MEAKTTGRFTGHLGFVLAAAGSAVGLGNLWRFPYLAAKDGGGLFLALYLFLLVTFGFTMLAAELSIGRKTRQSPVKAYATAHSGWGFLGVLTFLVPAIIMTYYPIIGGWILKYMVVYLFGAGQAAAQDSYFSNFIKAPIAPLFFTLVFLGLTSLIVYRGINKGIEKSAKFIMPVLLLVVIGVALYSLGLSYTDDKGITRTGMQGLQVYLIPNFEGLTFSRFLQILLDAMMQLFFSMSIAMGIMITYGSYARGKVNMAHSICHIGLFDTGVSVLAGLMIIPAIFVYEGMEGMASGPGLMFVSLPKVFAAMGSMGVVIALLFFLTATFAALTSSVSILETLTASCMEVFGASRKKVTLVLTAVYVLAASIVCMGYNLFYMDLKLPNGSTARLLDLMDYISTNVLMPLVALLSAVLVGWILKPQWVIDEMQRNGENFRLKRQFSFMIRYICPLIMVLLFLKIAGIV